MIAGDLLAKSSQALKSARVLLRGGDTDGVCNRAYYAMFNAARAALLAVGAPSDAAHAKTHNGLQSAFNQHVIKSGRLEQELG